MREKVRLYLEREFSHFEWKDFWPGKDWYDAINVFLAWALPSCIFVLWSHNYYPQVEFYKEAIAEGIGPNLWNAIGAFGVFAFGLAVIFSKFSIPKKIAISILSNTYAIGCLTFGLLVGQWLTAMSDSELVWWEIGLFGVTSGFLLVIVFFYNLVIWYLSYLLGYKEAAPSTLLMKLEEMHWLWRVAIGFFVALFITVIFLYEK